MRDGGKKIMKKKNVCGDRDKCYLETRARATGINNNNFFIYIILLSGFVLIHQPAAADEIKKKKKKNAKPSLKHRYTALEPESFGGCIN